MNALLGLQRFGVRPIRAALTRSPKTHCSVFKKSRLLHPRSYRTSVSLLEQDNNNLVGRTDEEILPKMKVASTGQAWFLTIAANKPRYRFPIVAGENGTAWYDGQVYKWGGEPPFLDCHNALFALLCNAYESVEGVSVKPVVTLATTSTGFGKTRILIEWIVQIFRHPFIVGSFLAAKSTVDNSITTDVETQIRTALDSKDVDQIKRANFLLRLFDAGISASIITIHAEKNKLIKDLISGVDVLTEAHVTKVCKAILITGLTSRFSNYVSNASMKLEEWDLADLAKHFIVLARETTSWPNFVTNVRPKPLLVINIDEVQDFVQKLTTRANKNLAFEIAKEFFKNLDRDYPVINMVGLHVGDLTAFKDQTRFFLVPYLPMDPLLQRKYLSEVCDKVLKKKLFSEHSSAGDCFNKDLSLQLHELWVSACGIPRTIESLIAFLRRLNLSSKQKLTPQELEPVRQAMTSDFTFADIRKQIGNLSEDEWHTLLLDFIFCKARRPTETILNTNTPNDLLEASGFIIPFHFQQPDQTITNVTMASRNYTIPFNLYPLSFWSPFEEFWLLFWLEIIFPSAIACVHHLLETQI